MVVLATKTEKNLKIRNRIFICRKIYITSKTILHAITYALLSMFVYMLTFVIIISSNHHTFLCLCSEFHVLIH